MKTHKELAIAACAAVAVGLVLVLVWTRRSDANRSDVNKESGVAPAVALAPGGTRPDAAPAVLDSTAQPVADSRARAPDAVPTESLAVVVLERANGARVADAEVRYASDEELTRVWDRTRSWVGTLEENLTSVGRAVRTDEHGEARIAPSSRPATVCARKGASWNYRAVPVHGEGTLSIELVTDRELELRVVDRAGKPVSGVPVALLSTSPQGFTFPIWQERTSDGGRAKVRHVDVLLENQPAHSNLAAGFDFMLLEARDVALDPKLLPSAPVELVLPPNGSVEVAIAVDPKYAAVQTGAPAGEVWLENADPKPPRGVFIQKGEARDGKALFTHVGTGLNLVVKGKNVFGFKPVTERGPGPEKDGDRARFELRFDDPYPALVGRLVDGRGGALADRAIEGRTEVRVEQDTTPASTFPAKSDGEGRFRVVLQVPTLPGLEGTAYLKVYGAGKSFEGLATVKLPAFLERGDNSIGDVAVEMVERVLSGTVVDERGGPVANVWVNVQRAEPLEGSIERVRWFVVPELQARTDRDGAFTILGRAPSARMRVIIAHEAFLRYEGPDFSAGDRDVRIQLAKSSMLVGSVITPDYFPLDVLTARVKPFASTASDAGTEPPPRTAPVLMDRTFQVRDLHEGRWSVDLMLQDDPRPLASVADIRLASGESVHDPRLVDVDLRNDLRCVRIRVEDPNGEAVPGASAWVDFGTPHQRSCRVDGKDARIVFRQGESELDVIAQGYRPVSLHNVEGDQTVTLVPRLEVELVLAAGTPVPEAPYYLGVKFRPIAIDGAEISSTREGRSMAPYEPRDRLYDAQGDVAFDATGRLSALLAAPGSYRLEWSVNFTANGVGSGSTFAASAGDRIDVHDSVGLQSFEVAPDQVQYARLLEALKRAWDGNK